MWYNRYTGFMPEYFSRLAQEVMYMANFRARTFLTTKNGIQSSFEILIKIGRHGKVEFCDLISSGPEVQRPRPFMFLDLLERIMPKYLFIGTIQVYFGTVQINNIKYGKHNQPCLIVQNERLREKEVDYLLNNLCTHNWVTSVYPINLCAMVQWWRENREEYFKKPRQVWEIKRLD